MDPTQEIMQEEAEKGINRSVKGIGAPHPSTERYGTTVAWFDGSVHFYTENLTLPTVRGFVSRNGGETLSEQYDNAP